MLGVIASIESLWEIDVEADTLTVVSGLSHSICQPVNSDPGDPLDCSGSSQSTG